MEWKMASVNRIILPGTVVGTPDFRILSGSSMAVSLCLETVFGNETESHDVTFYGQSGEIVMEYVAEGSLIYVDGTIRTRHYRDKNGIEYQMTGIAAQKMRILLHDKEPVSGIDDLFPAENP